jgi:hypothetical protein
MLLSFERPLCLYEKSFIRDFWDMQLIYSKFRAFLCRSEAFFD